MSELLDKVPPPPTAEISRLAEHFFRHEAGKLVSVLTSIFGIERLHLAEDVVQEALYLLFNEGYKASSGESQVRKTKTEVL